MSNQKLINRILLIHPPIEDFYQTKIRQQPLGLNYLHATLEQAGYETLLLDCLSYGQRKTIPLPGQLSYLKIFYPIDDLSPFRLFSHYYHFGLDYVEIENRIAEVHPDLIGISFNFTPYVDTALETARICKSCFPNVPVVAGGHHATAAPESLLLSGWVDFVILGEGELKMIELIECLNGTADDKLYDTDGLAFRDSGKIIIQPHRKFISDLNTLPNPATQGKIKPLLTTRGCPKKCNFCSVAGVMGKKIRSRSIDSVIEEMKIAVAAGISYFDFEDDNFTADQRRAKLLLQQIIQQFAGNQLTLSAMNGVWAESLDEELMRLMKQAGFEWLNLPLVSGDAIVQQNIGRFQSRQQFENVVQWAHTAGLKVIAYLILGLPEDNLQQMLGDIIFLAGLPVLLGPSIFYPPPGAVTFTNCLEKKYITGKDFLQYRSTAFPVETESFSRRELVTLLRLVRMINYLKNTVDQKLAADTNLFDMFDNSQLPPDSIVTEQKLTQSQIGDILIRLLFHHQQLKGIKRASSSDGKFHYRLFDYSISQNVVEQFLARLRGRKIVGTFQSVGLIFYPE